MLHKVLARSGYTTLVAQTPQEAMELAGRFTDTIDLLLTDIVMPVQSGPELAARLSLTYPALRVLFMSGYALDSTGHCVIPHGASFIHKPFRPDDLLTAIQRALESGEPSMTTP